mmetsp:Transcript_11974/g.24066  ORF Transcript_11974/g.24066 Transcript_11974/m.24066 type:complete len:84 (-) Transcript_11974:1540-1791(-)
MDSDDHLRGVPKQHTPTIASEMVTTRDEKMKNMRKKNGGSSSTSGDKTTPITTTTTTTTTTSWLSLAARAVAGGFGVGAAQGA